MTAPFIHPEGICETAHVGAGTRIWAFAHVLPGAVIGVDCNICDGVFIENDVVIGDRVTIKCGVQLWDGVHVESDVFIGPNATFTNDPFPRSRMRPAAFSRLMIRRGASIGANATVLPGLEIGAGAMVGAGSVVTRSVPPNAIVMGNPAGIVGYVESTPRSEHRRSASPVEPPPATGEVLLGVGKAALLRIRRHEDLRGALIVGEFAEELPFVPVRFFLVHAVPTREVRGEHAHLTCQQLLICVHGSCRVLVDDGRQRRQVTLDEPDLGLYVPPMIWGTQFQFSADATMLVFASHRYDAADYIRTYEDFITAVRLRA
jgi:acetyltransferase-like isoleucine patch superfamily enzyme